MVSRNDIRFYRHVLDKTLHRVDGERGTPEILWPDGSWQPDPGLDMIHYAMPVDAVRAGELARGVADVDVDLFCSGEPMAGSNVDSVGRRPPGTALLPSP